MMEGIKLHTKNHRDKEPKVTILFASYGRLPMLEEAVTRALDQDYPNFEVLVIDDGSDDETKSWLRDNEAQNPDLRVVFQQHQGVAVARATGVSAASGD